MKDINAFEFWKQTDLKNIDVFYKGTQCLLTGVEIIIFLDRHLQTPNLYRLRIRTFISLINIR